jgi:dipeptidyl aminopeptidase/acylaminoacyl peptidase
MKKTLFLYLFLLSGVLAHAQNYLNETLLWQLGRLSDVQISPDGKKALYAVKTYSIEENKGQNDLYIYDIPAKIRVKITDTKFSESNARWYPDGKSILFLCSESGSLQLWKMNPDGSERKQLTTLEDCFSGFEISPKGSYILYNKSVKIGKGARDLYPDLPKSTGEIYDGLMVRHWTEWSDHTYNHLFFDKFNGDLTLANQPKDLIPNEPFHAPPMPMDGLEQTCWSPDETLIAYACKKELPTKAAQSTNTDIYIYKIENGSVLNVSASNSGYDKSPSFSPDGKYIAWLQMQTPGYEADKNRIILYELNTRNTKDLTFNYDQSAEQIVWNRDSKKLFFISDVKATDHIFSCSITAPADQNVTKVTQGTFDVTSLKIGNNGVKDMLLCTRMSMSSPVELYTVDPAQGTFTECSFVNKPILDKLKLGKVESRMVPTTDNKQMLVWVIYPPDFDPAKKYPTLLYCQGGPQSTVSQFFSYRWNFQLMAAHGYIIVAPNRRGLPGFGQAWNDQITGDWGGQACTDYLSAIDNVSKEPFVDKDKMGAIGASYGGYSVYWLAGNHQKRFKTLIAHCGVFNLESMYGATEELFFVNHDLEGPYWNTPKPKSYDAFSPHKFVQNWDTPILVIHGDKDFRVPVTEGIQAYSAAKLKGLDSKFLWFPDEGHWVMQPQNSLLWNRVFFDWLDKYLK